MALFTVDARLTLMTCVFRSVLLLVERFFDQLTVSILSHLACALCVSMSGCTVRMERASVDCQKHELSRTV